MPVRSTTNFGLTFEASWNESDTLVLQDEDRDAMSWALGSEYESAEFAHGLGL